ncbi:MAG: integration host factor, actinobacterial type [Actinomycetota bacterium]
MPSPPALTEEQRRKALEKASQARRKRAGIKDLLRNGKIGLKDVIDSPDSAASGMKVSEALSALPGVGKVRVKQIMEKLDIAVSRRLRGLGARQKEALLKEFS